MRLVKGTIGLISFYLFLGYVLFAQTIPPPQINLSGNIGCSGFPCINTGTLVMAFDANRTMTALETSAMYIKVTSSVSLTTTRNLIAPAGRFNFTIENATTGGQSIQIIGASGTGITIANGTTVGVWNDGTNFVQIGSAGGSGPALQVNGTPNGSQLLLNLKAGTNVTITDDGVGGITFDAAGGSGGTPGGSNHGVQFNQASSFGGTAFTGILKASTSADPAAAVSADLAAINGVVTNPVGAQTITQPVNTNLNIITSGTGTTSANSINTVINAGASLSTAVTACGSANTTIQITQTIAVGSGITVPANCTLLFQSAGNLTGTSITINGGIQAASRQIFGSGLAVTLGPATTEVPIEWFGGAGDDPTGAPATGTDNLAAFNAAHTALSAGCIVFAGKSGYRFSGTASITKVNICVEGQTVGYPATAASISANSTNLWIDSASATGIDFTSTATWGIARGFALLRTQTPTGTAKGIAVEAGGVLVENVTSEDHIYPMYFHGANGYGTGLISNVSVGWGYTGLAGTPSPAVCGFFVDSSGGVGSASIRFFYDSVSSNLAGAGTTSGLCVSGTQVSDVYAFRFETSGTNHGIDVESTGTLNGTSQDIRFVDSILNTCLTDCLKINGVGSTTDIAPHVYVIGGNFFATGTSAVGALIENSSNVSMTNVQVFAGGTTQTDISLISVDGFQINDNQMDGESLNNVSCATSTHGTINNNQIKTFTAGTGIKNVGCTNVSEQTNSIGAPVGGTLANGITFDAASSNNGPWSLNNIDSATVTTPVSDAGTNNNTMKPSILVLNGGTPLTGQSSAQSQIVTCPTGGTSTQYCGADGAWHTISGGGNVSNTGTPVSGQMAEWTAATVIKGLNYPTLCSGGQFSLGLSSGSNNCSTPTTGITFPQTVGGTTTSGGIPYFSSTTVLTSSALLPTGDFVLGGGAGGAPTASFSVVPVANGGSGAGTFTIHGVLLGQTTGAFHVTAAGASNAVFMGQGAADPIFVAQPVIDCTNCTNVPSSTPAYPQTVTGCVSGGILYGSLSTQVTCSPAGTAGQVVLWGGAGTAPGAQAIGTSGATLPLLNGANTWSGQQTYAAPIVSSLIPGSSSSEILFEGAPFSGGSGTTTFPLMLASPGAGPTTWSTGGTFFGVSSQSGFAGNFLDFHVNGGASIAKVDSAGASTNSNVTDSALTQGQQVVAGTSGLLANGGTAILACADTSASGTAQTCTTSPSFTPAANSCVIYTTTTANSGTGLTLNVNSLGAKSVAKWLGSTTLAAGDVAATSPQLACYNGTVWNLSTIGNAPSGGGGGLSGMTPAQIPVAATATTVTSSKGLGGSNTLIATIAAIGSSGVAIVSDGSNGIASSGVFLSAFANTTANNSFSGYVQQTVMPRYTVATVASATTIAPTTPLVIISGTTTVTTITAPSGTAALIGAAFDMITSSAVLFNTGGNIATAFTSQPGLQYHCAFMGTTNGLWYCQDINTVLRGNITLTTATSDALTITGVTTASVCSFDATNSTAAGITTTLAGFYTVTANTFTLNHAATVAAGATYGVICTVD